MDTDGSVVIGIDLNVNEAEKELARLKKKFLQLGEEVGRNKAHKNALVKEYEQAIEKYKEYAKLHSAGIDKETGAHVFSEDDKKTADQLYDAAEKIYKEIEKYDESIKQTNIDLNYTKERYGEIFQAQQRLKFEAEAKAAEEAAAATAESAENAGAAAREMTNAAESAEEAAESTDKAATATEKMKLAAERVSAAVERFANRIKRLSARVFVFTMITTALRSMRTWLNNVITTNDKATAAIAKLKGALLTLAQPLVNVVIPAFMMLVQAVTQVVSAIASFVSFIFGTTAEESASAAEALYDEQNAIKGVGAAAKKASKDMASFDTIDKLSGEDSSGGGGDGGTSGDIAPDFSFIQDGINGILGLITGAALLAVGAILAFSGVNVPLGIAMMALGAMTIWAALASNPELVQAMVESGLAAIFEAIGPWIAVIGVILLIFGHILLGLALIIAGIAIWAIGSGAQGEGDFAQLVVRKLIEAAGVIGPVLAVIGILLMVTGKFLLGLGIFLTGLALWGFSEANSDDGSSMQSKIISVLRNVAYVLAPVLAVIGIVLMVTGKLFLGLGMFLGGLLLFNIAEESTDDGKSIQDKIISVLTKTADVIGPVLAVIGIMLIVIGKWLLGIGMFLGGIALFNIEEATEDNGLSIQEKIFSVLERMSGLLIAAGAFFIVIGILLMFVPGQQARGMGMIIAGVTSLGVGLLAHIEWDFILNAVSGAFERMKSWWDANAAEFFSLEYWAGLAKDMLDGLFGGLANLGRRITEWGSSFISGVKDFFGIHSPSTEFETLGDFMIQGLRIGVEAGTANVILAFKNMYLEISALGNSIVSAFSISFSSISLSAANCVSTIKSYFNSFLTYVSGDFYTTMTAVLENLHKVVQELFDESIFIMLDKKYLEDLLDYLNRVFFRSWADGWENARKVFHDKVYLIIQEIGSLVEAIANIERDITITIRTVYESGGGPVAPSAAPISTPYSINSGLKLNIPALARGAVIPANREFMAVLGDQKHGTNIETPLDTMIQAFKTAWQEMGGTGRQEAVFEVDGETFGRLVWKLGNRETDRVGVNLVEG